MAIVFNGHQIPGAHGPVITTGPALQEARTKFFGVKGESRIGGETGGREIYTHIWFFGNFRTEAAIVAALQQLDRWAGEHGIVQIVKPGGIPRVFQECTFHGFAIEEPGPLPDLAGTIDGGFWCPGLLRWYQLSVHLDR